MRVLTTMEQFHKDTAERYITMMRAAYHEFYAVAAGNECKAGCACGWVSTGPAYDTNEGARREWYYFHMDEIHPRIGNGGF